MCYSAEVSFAAASVLFPVGALTTGKAIRSARWFWPMAIVPCVFGVQQASEGVVWLGLDRQDPSLACAASAVYLFFALCFWPIWFSLVAVLLEPAGSRRRLLWIWTLLSTFWFFAIYIPALLDLDASRVQVFNRSIRYEFSDSGSPLLAPLSLWIQRVLYAMTGAVPLLASSHRKLFFIPVVLVLVAAAAVAIFYDANFTSIWCLWAAIASLTIIYSTWRAACETGQTPRAAATEIST